MGGQSSSTQTQQSQTAPWQSAQPMLQTILGQLNPLLKNSGLNATESGAINQLSQNAALGNPYTSQISGLVSNLLGGGGAGAQAPALQSGLLALQSQLTPYANGSAIGSNPALQAQLDQIATDTTNQVNSQFASSCLPRSSRRAAAGPKRRGRNSAISQAPRTRASRPR